MSTAPNAMTTTLAAAASGNSQPPLRLTRRG
jgi:hypothetical protein